MKKCLNPKYRKITEKIDYSEYCLKQWLLQYKHYSSDNGFWLLLTHLSVIYLNLFQQQNYLYYVLIMIYFTYDLIIFIFYSGLYLNFLGPTRISPIPRLCIQTLLDYYILHSAPLLIITKKLKRFLTKMHCCGINIMNV